MQPQPQALLPGQRQHERGIEVTGSIGARPIILLHCAAANRQNWRPQLETLGRSSTRSPSTGLTVAHALTCRFTPHLVMCGAGVR